MAARSSPSRWLVNCTAVNQDPAAIAKTVSGLGAHDGTEDKEVGRRAEEARREEGGGSEAAAKGG